MTPSLPAGDALPPEVSGDGRRNAYYHECRIMGCKMSYASCAHKVSERKHGALPAIYAACSAAIGNKTCPVLPMLKEEQEKGRAIYFLERVRFGAVAAIVDKAKDLLGKIKPAGKPEPAKQVKTGVGSDYMAQAINAAVKDEDEDKRTKEMFARIHSNPNFAAPNAAKLVKEAVEAGKVAQAAPNKPRPGESMLEMGRRLIAERKAAAKN